MQLQKPPCLTCMMNAIKAVAKAGLSTTGVTYDMAPAHIIKARRDKCRVCPYSVKNPDPRHAATNGLTNLSQCTKCDCNIALKTKIKSEKCPIAEW